MHAIVPYVWFCSVSWGLKKLRLVLPYKPTRLGVGLYSYFYCNVYSCLFLINLFVAISEFIPGLPFISCPGFPDFFIPAFPEMKTSRFPIKWEEPSPPTVQLIGHNNSVASDDSDHWSWAVNSGPCRCGRQVCWLRQQAAFATELRGRGEADILMDSKWSAKHDTSTVTCLPREVNVVLSRQMPDSLC